MNFIPPFANSDVRQASEEYETLTRYLIERERTLSALKLDEYGRKTSLSMLTDEERCHEQLDHSVTIDLDEINRRIFQRRNLIESLVMGASCSKRRMGALHQRVESISTAVYLSSCSRDGLECNIEKELDIQQISNEDQSGLSKVENMLLLNRKMHSRVLEDTARIIFQLDRLHKSKDVAVRELQSKIEHARTFMEGEDAKLTLIRFASYEFKRCFADKLRRACDCDVVIMQLMDKTSDASKRSRSVSERSSFLIKQRDVASEDESWYNRNLEATNRTLQIYYKEVNCKEQELNKIGMSMKYQRAFSQSIRINIQEAFIGHNTIMRTGGMSQADLDRIRCQMETQSERETLAESSIASTTEILEAAQRLLSHSMAGFHHSDSGLSYLRSQMLDENGRINELHHQQRTTANNLSKVTSSVISATERVMGLTNLEESSLKQEVRTHLQIDCVRLMSKSLVGGTSCGTERTGLQQHIRELERQLLDLRTESAVASHVYRATVSASSLSSRSMLVLNEDFERNESLLGVFESGIVQVGDESKSVRGALERCLTYRDGLFADLGSQRIKLGEQVEKYFHMRAIEAEKIRVSNLQRCDMVLKLNENRERNQKLLCRRRWLVTTVGVLKKHIQGLLHTLERRSFLISSNEKYCASFLRRTPVPKNSSVKAYGSFTRHVDKSNRELQERKIEIEGLTNALVIFQNDRRSSIDTTKLEFRMRREASINQFDARIIPVDRSKANSLKLKFIRRNINDITCFLN
jgi:hypothetical protein